ncbi:MAG: TolC family protein [Chthoniobacterales bacterium]
MALSFCALSSSFSAEKQKDVHRQEKPLPVLKTEVTKFQPGKTYDLAKLIDLGLANNPYTRAAWQNAVAAAAATGEARAPYYPKATVHVIGGADQGYTMAANGPNNYQRVQVVPVIALEYLLVDFGRRNADLERTLHALDAANLTYDRQMQRTVFAIQRAYYHHNAALSQEKAAAANLELARTIVAMVSERMKSGLATQPEVLFSTKVLTQAQLDSEMALRNVKTTLGQLRTAAGIEANAPLTVLPLTIPSSYTGLQEKLDTLIDSGLKNRPDLASRIADLRAREAATRRAKADFLPQVRLQGSYENDTFSYHGHDGQTSGTYSENRNGFGAFAVVDWDLFDGFERVQRVKRRLAEEEGSRAEIEVERLNTILDVWTSYYDMTTAKRRVDFAISLLASSQEAFNATEASYNAGLATITEFVTAQNDLATARYERANADADYLTAVASLTLSMGTNSSQAAANKN